MHNLTYLYILLYFYNLNRKALIILCVLLIVFTSYQLELFALKD